MAAVPSSTAATPAGDALSADDLYRLGSELKIQLESEATMAAQESLEKHEKDYLMDRENDETKLNFAAFLVRRPELALRRRGVDLLMDLLNDKETTADERSLLYYLAVAHYRLHCLSEADRYIRILLQREPSNRQALAFQHLLGRARTRRLMVLVNGSEASDLAFYRMLEIIQKGDHVILFTSIHSKDADSTNDDGYLSTSSLRAARVNFLGEDIQRRYRFICEERGLSYSFVIEEGEPLKDVCDLIRQEHIDTVFVGYGSAETAGFFDRITSTPCAEYLFKHAKCDVIVAKAKKGGH